MKKDDISSDPKEKTVRPMPSWFIVMAILYFGISLSGYLLIVRSRMDQLWSMIDLEVYRSAGLAVRSGHNLYQTDFTSVHLPFTYTPLAGIIFASMTYLSLDTLRVVITIASIMALVTVVWVSWGLLNYPRSLLRLGATLLVSAIVLWLEPVQQTLSFGQINLLLMAIIIVDLCQRDDRFLKGVGVGFATAFKLTPIIFVMYLFLTRRFQAAIVASLTFVATIAYSFLVLPKESSQYWSGLFLDSSRVGGVSFVGNQSLHGTLTRLFHGVDSAQPYWFIAVAIIGVLGLSLAVYASQQKKELLGIFTCSITGLLISPISWSHHWVWIVLLVVLLIHLSSTKKNFLRWLSVAALLVLFGAWFIQTTPDVPSIPQGIIWGVPAGDDREFSWHGFQHIQGELYVIIGLAFLIFCAFFVFHRRQWFFNRINFFLQRG